MGMLEGVGALANTGWNVFSTLYGWHRDDWNTRRMWEREDAIRKEMYEREDNAVQRRVSDLQKAGLSPVLAAGSAASASTYGGASPVQNSSKAMALGNPVQQYLDSIQTKADIARTNADKALTDKKAEAEEQNIAFLKSSAYKAEQEAKGQELRNAWINQDMVSKLKLRGIEGQQKEQTIQNLIAEHLAIQERTNLLKADTAYRQAEKDLLLTNIDLSKIQRDQANFNLTTSGLRLYNDTYAVNKGIGGKVFGDIRNLFTGPDIFHAIKNIDDSWYWEKK